MERERNQFPHDQDNRIQKLYYDINIHTWDTNIIERDTFNNNKNYINTDINKEYIYNLFKKNSLNIIYSIDRGEKAKIAKIYF